MSKPTPEQKALQLVGRYARLKHRSIQCKKTTGNLFDMCEKPVYLHDVTAGSGCIAYLAECKADGLLVYVEDGESNWLEIMANFCKPCALAMKVSRHRKRTLAKRLSTVLGSMKRLGSKV